MRGMQLKNNLTHLIRGFDRLLFDEMLSPIVSTMRSPQTPCIAGDVQA